METPIPVAPQNETFLGWTVPSWRTSNSSLTFSYDRSVNGLDWWWAAAASVRRMITRDELISVADSTGKFAVASYLTNSIVRLSFPEYPPAHHTVILILLFSHSTCLLAPR